MDVFKEQIVKRQPTAKDTAIKVCLVIIVILLAFIFFFILLLGSIGLLLTVGLGFGARFLASYLNVEYEYVLTNGELDIDIIYDQSRRKRVFSTIVKNVELLSHAANTDHEHTLNSAQQTLDFSTGITDNDTYIFLTNYNGKKTKVIISPNEKMLKAFSNVIPKRNMHLRSGVYLS
jgi:hypothetical protein